MSERRDLVWALGLGASLSLLLLITPLWPSIDWPQHLALATQLRRIWSGDQGALATFAANVATHNAGVHVAIASLGSVLSIPTAARLLMGLYPIALIGSVTLLLRVLGLPAWRAVLVIPAVLGFSFGWGFANFCAGSAIAWLTIALFVKQLDAPTATRAAILATLSLALGVTHVMAMLLTACVALASGVEWAARARCSWVTRLGRTTLAGAPLFAGCVYDLWVLASHLSASPASYTSAPDGFDQYSAFRKLGFLGTFVSGLLGTYADTVIAWWVIGLVTLMAAAAWFEPRTVWGLEGDRDLGCGVNTLGPRPLVAPFLVLGAVYLLVPSVFLNTHLVFQRVAQWVLVAGVIAIPPLRREASARRVGLFLGGASAALSVAHFGWFTFETRGIFEVLAAVPRGSKVTGFIERTRTVSIRMGVLSHTAALAVPYGAADEAFSFGRFMGMPVVYRPGRAPTYPAQSWEHGNHPYRPDSDLARAYPVLLVRLAWEGESSESVAMRLFASPVRALSRAHGWVLFDTRAVSHQ